MVATQKTQKMTRSVKTAKAVKTSKTSKMSRVSKTTRPQKHMTSLEALGQAAECLRILAHPHRLRMIQLLLQGDHIVTELAQACELPTAMTSEHLRLMQRCGLLSSSKQGRKVYYKVAEPHLKHILKCIENRFDTDLPK